MHPPMPDHTNAHIIIFIIEKMFMGGEMSFCPLVRPRHLLQFRMEICLVLWLRYLMI